MNLGMVTATKRDGEFIANFARQRPTLSEAKVVCVGRTPAADQARLLGNKLDMLAIADPARLGKVQLAFVDPR
jgi:hypothetical protein